MLSNRGAAAWDRSSRARIVSAGRTPSPNQGYVFATVALATIERVRYPVVLFDFDGTVVDSGGIILASMRHATETVLARSYSEQELLANVGGPGLEAQMAAFAPDRVEELVRVYRQHNEALHDELEAFDGIEHVLTTLKEEGRTLGLVTAKRRGTVDLAFARLPIEHFFDVVVDTAEELLGVL